MSNNVLSTFEQSVVEAATKHDDNWEAVAFEVDRDPELVQTVAQGARAKLAAGNGSAASAPAPRATSAGTRRECVDPECSVTFVAKSNAQKFCKDTSCQRRRWAREKRAQSGAKPAAAAKPTPTPKASRLAAPTPAPPAAPVRQELPASDLAGRYIGALLERALADLTPEQARAEIERLARIAA